MEHIAYRSRSELFKYPFSAVKAGEKITFKVVLPRAIQCSGVQLCLHRDNCDELRFDLFWLRMEGTNEEWWCIDYIPQDSGLYYYHFDYTTPFGVLSIRHNGDTCGVLSGGLHDWQLTVYDRDFKAVDWLKGGLIYQIFPDRFYNSGTKKQNVPADRVLRGDWGGEPDWKPTKEGRVLNNDYFGGDLEGIRQKLDYLSSLGVTCLYLNPIFEAQSNHRYDTGDYEKIDPVLGTEDDLKHLCADAKEHDIRVILDGVFSHTGDDSRYFNKYGRYDSLGAFQSKKSPYYPWYKFQAWPHKYTAWWGIDILPEVQEETPSFIDYIAGENGVAAKWLRCGVSGWRLDVADELPDVFLDAFRKRVKTENPEALILGEVWEDASNKSSYGHRRRYLQGRQLDSVMNYPFADAILSFIRSGVAEGFSDRILIILENYPKCVTDILMNHIGTHDTMRAITALAGESCEGRDRPWQSKHHLSKADYQKGVKLLKLAAVLQYTLPGVPSLYYGDEAGMEGYKDPFNRGCYPWGKENADLLAFYRLLGQVRKGCDCLRDGSFFCVSEMLSCLAFERENKSDAILVIINRNEHPITYHLPERWQFKQSVFGATNVTDCVSLGALDAVILKKEKSNGRMD